MEVPGRDVQLVGDRYWTASGIQSIFYVFLQCARDSYKDTKVTD